MSGTTSVPPITFTDRGAAAPSEASIVTGLDADWSAAFGGNLNTAPSSPAGQLIASEAAMLGDANDQEVWLFNNVDPAYASGRMQDAIARIYFLFRIPASSTVLSVACVGAVNVVIPAGSLVADGEGNIWYSTTDAVIPLGGTINVEFQAQVPGPIPVPASVAIYQAIPGWNTATIVSGSAGSDAENRTAFETRRQATVAANGAGFLPAIGGAVAKVPGVVDYYVTENPTAAAVTIGGVSVAARSMFVCVSGGDSAAVAYAIWTKKNPGCGYTGNTTVAVNDTNSGYSPPYPSYNVTFERPGQIGIVVLVQITNSTAVPSDAAAQIQAAVVSAFNGGDGGPRARIGSMVYASRFYGAVAALGAWAQIINVKIGSTFASTATFTGAISGTTLTVSSVVGTIAVGQFVFGASGGVADGTFILSGAGLSWVVSVNQTVASTAMETLTANLDDVQMNINQQPVLAARNVQVGLN